eukprot:m.657694 g.657694  ORF g.657694 m.657694 type:complete len:855 (-) comp58437_c0_seq7:2330-4894(-)
MGVTGLWRVVAGGGTNAAPPHAARLAVDASLAIYQVTKGIRTPNPHITGMLNRICSLLFQHIRPVFVFDGPPPPLKHRTLAERRQQRERSEARLAATNQQLLLNHLRHQLLEELENENAGDEEPSSEGDLQIITPAPAASSSTATPATSRAESTRPKKLSLPVSGSGRTKDMFELPAPSELWLPTENGFDLADFDPQYENSDDEDDEEGDIETTGHQAGTTTSASSLQQSPLKRHRHKTSTGVFVLDSADIDVDSADFNALPLEIQHDAILDIKQRMKTSTRKREFGRTTTSTDFSQQQLTGLMQRSKLSRKLDEVREALLKSQAVIDGITAHKIISEDNTFFIFEKKAPTLASSAVSLHPPAVDLDQTLQPSAPPAEESTASPMTPPPGEPDTGKQALLQLTPTRLQITALRELQLRRLASLSQRNAVQLMDEIADLHDDQAGSDDSLSFDGDALIDESSRDSLVSDPALPVASSISQEAASLPNPPASGEVHLSGSVGAHLIVQSEDVCDRAASESHPSQVSVPPLMVLLEEDQASSPTSAAVSDGVPVLVLDDLPSSSLRKMVDLKHASSPPRTPISQPTLDTEIVLVRPAFPVVEIVEPLFRSNPSPSSLIIRPAGEISGPRSLPVVGCPSSQLPVFADHRDSSLQGKDVTGISANQDLPTFLNEPPTALPSLQRAAYSMHHYDPAAPQRLEIVVSHDDEAPSLLSEADADEDDSEMIDVPLGPLEASPRSSQSIGATAEPASEVREVISDSDPEDLTVVANKALPPQPQSPTPATAVQRPVQVSSLLVTQAALDAERQQLIEQAGKAARTSALITPEIIADVQQLLKLFGIPFVLTLSHCFVQPRSESC